MKPVIGITTDISNELETRLKRAYVEAVIDSGGYPVLLAYTANPNFSEILQLVDGILLSGGGDIEPALFGQERHPKIGEISKVRDDFEIPLCKLAIAENKPLLGICRGVQVLNVAANGTLDQHINHHSLTDITQKTTHCVQIHEGTMLSRIMNVQTATVNSRHHQCAAKVGDSLVISATAEDGTIEALEMPDKKFVLGLQWHPENIYKDYSYHHEIFKRFIANSQS